jgi:hypothetical protein
MPVCKLIGGKIPGDINLSIKLSTRTVHFVILSRNKDN